MRGVALLELFPSSLFGVFRTSHQMMAIKKALLRNINFDSATSSNSPVAMAKIDVTTLLALFATEAGAAVQQNCSLPMPLISNHITPHCLRLELETAKLKSKIVK